MELLSLTRLSLVASQSFMWMNGNEGTVKNKAVYLALGITRTGSKEVLGIWVVQTEGAKFWMRVMSELKNRGVQDILICLIDGLKGFPEAISARFFRARRCRPASCTCCATHLNLRPGRIAKPSRWR